MRKPKPYLKPAMERARPAMVRALSKATKDAFLKAMKGLCPTRVQIPHVQIPLTPRRITIPIQTADGIGSVTYTIEELAVEYVRASKIAQDAQRALDEATGRIFAVERQNDVLRALLGSVRRLTDAVPAILS